MKRISILLVLLGLLAPPSFAATDQPAGNAILVAPFAGLGDSAQAPWIGQALQQNLLTELSRLSHLQTFATPRDVPPPVDIPAAAKLGQQYRAALVVCGTYQVSQAGLRINGLVVDARTGRLVGGMKATGTIRDLFLMEDTVSEQAKRAVLQQFPAPRPQPQVAVAEPQQPQEPQVPESPMPWYGDPALYYGPTSYYDDYSRHRSRYYYGYPYWGYYGQPWVVPGVIYGRPYYRSRWYNSRTYWFPGGVIRVPNW